MCGAEDAARRRVRVSWIVLSLEYGGMRDAGGNCTSSGRDAPANRPAAAVYRPAAGCLSPRSVGSNLSLLLLIIVGCLSPRSVGSNLRLLLLIIVLYDNMWNPVALSLVIYSAGGELPWHTGLVANQACVRCVVHAHLDTQVSLASMQDDERLILVYCLGLLEIRPTDPSVLGLEQ